MSHQSLKNCIKIFSLVLFFTLTNVKGNPSHFYFSGYINYTYISRLSDQSIINVPYRMAALNMENQSENLLLNGSFVLEYHLREDAYFLGSSNPQEKLEVRKSYLSQKLQQQQQINSVREPADDPAEAKYQLLVRWQN